MWIGAFNKQWDSLTGEGTGTVTTDEDYSAHNAEYGINCAPLWSSCLEEIACIFCVLFSIQLQRTPALTLFNALRLNEISINQR